MKNEEKFIFYYNTIIGKIGIVDNGTEITHILFETSKIPDATEKETENIKKASLELKEFFTGKRQVFDIRINPNGTDFQKKVWHELVRIPYGETRTYKEIAEMIGNPNASRAVGMANNRNPIPIIIPCHRVVGSDQKLVGYAGGLDIKKRLLDIEK